MVSTITWSKTKINPILWNIYHAECPLLMSVEAARAHISRKSKRLIHESVRRCVTRCYVTRIEHVVKNSMWNQIWSICSYKSVTCKTEIDSLRSKLLIDFPYQFMKSWLSRIDSLPFKGRSFSSTGIDLVMKFQSLKGMDTEVGRFLLK